MSLVEKNFGRALGVRRVGIFFALIEEFRGGVISTRGARTLPSLMRFIFVLYVLNPEDSLKHSRAHFKIPKVCSARSQSARSCYLARS